MVSPYARTIQVCNNLSLAISMIGVAEAMSLGSKMGMDPKVRVPSPPSRACVYHGPCTQHVLVVTSFATDERREPKRSTFSVMEVGLEPHTKSRGNFL